MNWDRISGEWKQIKGELKAKWAKLTDEDLKVIEAKKDELVGKLQERYGIVKDEAEKQINEWMSKLGAKKNVPPPAPPTPPRSEPHGADRR